MDLLPSVESVAEIVGERAALEAAVACRSAGLRGEEPAGGSPGALAGRCSPENRRRLDKLAWWEARLPPEFADDCGLLIVLGSQVVEQELARIVAAPAHAVGTVLLRAVEGRAKPPQSAALAGWLDGRVPVTMGMLEIILYALRRGWELELAEVREFLASAFRPGYADLLATNGPARALARMRQDYRNPAAHGLAAISAAGYGEFCELAVACTSFGQWRRAGTIPPPPPDRGLLHHHLTHLLGHSDLAPRPALLDLATPAGSPRIVRVEVERVTPAAFRGIGLVSRQEGDGFRVGDAVRFVLEVNAPCWVALLALSADGGATALLPNRLRPYHHSAGGMLCVPDRATPECTFPLEGPPGTETVLALATREPCPFPLLPDEPNAVMRRLTAPEVVRLTAKIMALPSDSWAVGWCRFEVTA